MLQGSQVNMAAPSAEPTLSSALAAASILLGAANDMENTLRAVRQHLTGEQINEENRENKPQGGAIPHLHQMLSEAGSCMERAAFHSRFIQVALGGDR